MKENIKQYAIGYGEFLVKGSIYYWGVGIFFLIVLWITGLIDLKLKGKKWRK